MKGSGVTVSDVGARPDDGRRNVRQWRSPDRLLTHAAITSLAFLAYLLARWLDGPAALVFAAIGVSSCGWAWLMARALFDPARTDAIWPRLVVGVLMGAGVVAALGSPDSLISGTAAKIYAISGSAALLLTLIEPFQRHGCVISPSEKRFRLIFVVVFAGLVGAAVLGVWIDRGPVQTLCALVGLCGVMAATAFRLRHPLTKATRPAAAPRPIREEDADLTERLVRLLQDQAIYAEPDLRACDVAAKLGAPEYRISRCVSGLGFSNFNRLINHHRIALAKSLLSDPREERSILDIALDCGFASTGPFNRAFKSDTGMTPRAYRTNRLRPG